MGDVSVGRQSTLIEPEVPPPTRRPRGRRRRILIAIAVVVCLALPATGWVALGGVHARDHLLNAANLLRQLQTQISAGNIPAAGATLGALEAETGAAREQTSDPLWRLASHIPGVGRNLGAIATIAEVLDDLAHNGLPPLMAIASTADPAALAPRDGHVNVAALATAAPQIAAADAAMRDARDRVDAIDATLLASPVAAAVTSLRDELRHAAGVTSTASLAARVLPAMLGMPTPRTYLVMFQNLAETRATGGMMGAFAIVRADQGHVSIVSQGTASRDLQVFDNPVLPLDPALSQLYTQRPGKFPADVNATPHFPTAALLARQMYTMRTGRTVDGVIATDPVALSYLLPSTTGVPVQGGAPLTKENAVRLLLSDVYFKIPVLTQQDKYFADASRAVFDALTKGLGDPKAALAGLVRGAAERRILVWSADPAEEQLLAGTVLGGVLPDSDGARPTIGIFLNDGTGAKLGYYLTRTAAVSVGHCRVDGRREVKVSVTLGSTAPATGLPNMISGYGDIVPLYTLRTNLMVFSPTKGTIVAATRDGAAIPLGVGSERGRAVALTTVDLRPGQSTTVDVTLLTGKLPAEVAAGFTPTVWTTPGIDDWPVATTPAEPCAGTS